MLYKWVMKFGIIAFVILLIVGYSYNWDEASVNFKINYFFIYGLLLGGWFMDSVYKKKLLDLTFIALLSIIVVVEIYWS